MLFLRDNSLANGVLLVGAAAASILMALALHCNVRVVPVLLHCQNDLYRYRYCTVMHVCGFDTRTDMLLYDQKNAVQHCMHLD